MFSDPHWRYSGTTDVPGLKQTRNSQILIFVPWNCFKPVLIPLSRPFLNIPATGGTTRIARIKWFPSRSLIIDSKVF